MFFIALILTISIVLILINRYRIIQKAKKEQERIFTELDQLKSQFFTNISHEFRTPLTLILGPVEKRLVLATNEEDRVELTLVQRNAKRLLNLVNQLLDISRLEMGALTLHCKPGEINGFVKTIATQFESMSSSKNIDFKFIPTEPTIIFYDPDKLDKIIFNLLSNAFKFTPSGKSITLTLNTGPRTSHFEEGYIELQVTDEGIGIPQSQLTKIFDRFYQVENSNTRGYEGSGIGLALTKELAEMHHGTIHVTSIEDKGSTFTVRLPGGTKHLKANEISYSEPTRIPEHSFEPMDSSFAGDTRSTLPHLLIIEDNSDLCYYLENSLKSQYTIHIAQDGETGVNVAIETIPDLIISDLMMPALDGLQVCKQIKENEKTSHILYR